jgi:hypothetical protein
MLHKRSQTALIALSALAILALICGSIACKKAEDPAVKQQAEKAKEGSTLSEGVNEIAGTVKSALGKYFYVSQLPGYDIVAAGAIEGGDATSLLGKDVRAKVVFNRQAPGFLVAQSIEIKESETQFKSVFTGTETNLPADTFAQSARADYPALTLTNIAKSADWEGKGKGRVRGKLVPGAGGQGQAISVLSAENKELGKVIVDSMSEYASYYVKKLRLFDTYWFYLNIKDSVAANARAKNKEMFHADVVFTGLY